MKSEIVSFFEVERQIFGICPKCNRFFRLSECKIFLKGEKTKDWLDEMDRQQERLEKQREKLEEARQELKKEAREKGRKQAQELTKNIDLVFSPKGLNPDDAKIIFNPIDYIVFNGMNSSAAISHIVLFDRVRTDSNAKAVQKSIQKTVDKGKYEWQTVVIDEEGGITYK